MYIVVFVTCAKKEEARKIAKALLKSKLAACVNITGAVESFFWWKARIDRSSEYLLVAKSTRAKLKGIIKKVGSLHSYEVPEIIALPVCAGSKAYLDWIDESIG